MLNKIVIMGRLTRDPELRQTQNQIPVASFTLAVDRDFGEETDFIDRLRGVAEDGGVREQLLFQRQNGGSRRAFANTQMGR